MASIFLSSRTGLFSFIFGHLPLSSAAYGQHFCAALQLCDVSFCWASLCYPPQHHIHFYSTSAAINLPVADMHRIYIMPSDLQHLGFSIRQWKDSHLHYWRNQAGELFDDVVTFSTWEACQRDCWENLLQRGSLQNVLFVYLLPLSGTFRLT